MRLVVREALIHFLVKFNVSWVLPGENPQTADDIVLNGVEMIAADEADGISGALLLLDHLPDNVTMGPIVNNRWCRLASSPMMRSSVLTNGPESALRQIGIELLLISFMILFLMFYLNELMKNRTNFMISAWLVYANSVRQNVRQNISLKESFIVGYMVLILSALLFQILFGCMLHTERTSISSFTRIDSFRDVQAHNLTKFIPDISACSRMVGQDLEYRVVNLAHQFVAGEDLSWCVATGKCVILLNNLDYYAVTSFTCSIYPKIALKNPPYLSPILVESLGGYLINKRILKEQRDQIDGYIQHSYEMGLEKKNGFLSKAYARKAIEAFTQLAVNEECFSKTIQMSLSSPVPLSFQFLKNCFILYSMIVFLSILFHVFQSKWPELVRLFAVSRCERISQMNGDISIPISPL